MTAGADPTPVEPGSWPSPGQYLHRWNTMTEAERLDEAAHVIELCQERHDARMIPPDVRRFLCCNVHS